MTKMSDTIRTDKSPLTLVREESDMADRTKGAAHRALLAPLIGVISSRLDELPVKEGQKRPTYEQIAQESGLDYWTVARIINGAVMSPPYVDLTRLAVAAGLSPNQAAELSGLWNETANQTGQALDPHLVQTIGMLYSAFPEEERRNFILTMYNFADALIKRGFEAPGPGGPAMSFSRGRVPLKKVGRPRRKA